MIYALLKNHPSKEMQHLAEIAICPQTGKETRQFWLHLRGTLDEAKKTLLNAILCIFCHWFRKVEYRDRNVEEMTEEERAQVSNDP